MAMELCYIFTSKGRRSAKIKGNALIDGRMVLVKKASHYWVAMC